MLYLGTIDPYYRSAMAEFGRQLTKTYPNYGLELVDLVPRRSMKKNEFGSMIHISSIDALSGDSKPQDAYGASKAAMIRLSKSIAIQYANYQIRSNIILPGAVETPMQKRWKNNPKAKKKLAKIIPLKRVGQPEDIPNAALFLLSDQSEYITGTELIVDGGITSKPNSY